jgi:NTP pyrophosphatase (non-canonical NTP hydrolase)
MTINEYADMCYTRSRDAGWWDGNLRENPLAFSNKLFLIVSELVESLEADRKDLADDKLPHRHGREVELADATIRIFDLAGAFGFDLEGAINEKLEFNRTREDHTREHRASKNGKKY